MTGKHEAEVERGERFEFGKNWAAFLSVLDEERIGRAVAALRDGIGELHGKTFLDVGSGSGLSSLAARRLGARVHSFDYDPHSVACTRELRRREGASAADWRVEEGSVLDEQYLAGLGTFDVVYSWGVLHHTGAMWRALGNVAPLVAPGGRLWLALYNDQGGASERWKRVKRTYNRAPRALRPAIVAAVGAFFGARHVLIRAVRLQNPVATRTDGRGMSLRHDLVDWVGGWPFEVAKPDEVVAFYRARGFRVDWLRTVGGNLGCNEYLLARRA
jgi:2-polyprenyl-6-hydroxyphenyl methylase/3-demethylubiquinone-9 3-methyltransferase